MLQAKLIINKCWAEILSTVNFKNIKTIYSDLTLVVFNKERAAIYLCKRYRKKFHMKFDTAHNTFVWKT